MNTVYGLYMVEASKPRILEEPLVIVPDSSPGKVIKCKEEQPGIQRCGLPARRLRVQSKITSGLKSDTSCPEIKLSGQWLKQIGFAAGQQIRVTTSHQKMVIEIDDTG